MKHSLLSDANEKGDTSMDRNSYDKFTQRARKVLSLAQEEAQRFQHNYIGTEHLLLGLVRDGEGGRRQGIEQPRRGAE